MTVFEDFIYELQQVKKDSDITPAIIEKLIFTAVSTLMHEISDGNDEIDDLEALRIARSSIIEYTDELMLKLYASQLKKGGYGLQ